MRKDIVNFFVPIQIQKGKNESGEEVMKIGGIASTYDKDSDGENLDPNGFLLDDLVKSGFINWNHQAKNNPSAIIGEPTKAEIRKEGLYLEAELYGDSQLAKDVFTLAKALQSSKSKRTLGFSIEGKVLERDPKNPKIIKKANITGVAITPTPKNKFTLAQILKGEGAEYDESEVQDFEVVKSETNEIGQIQEYIVDVTKETGERITVDKNLNIKIEKAITTEAASGGPLKKESLEGKEDLEDPKVKKDKKKDGEAFDGNEEKVNFNRKLNKSEVYEVILTQESDLEKAKQIFNLVQEIENLTHKQMATENTTGTTSQESLNKAFEILSIAKKELEKAEGGQPLTTSTTQVDISKADMDKTPAKEKGSKESEENDEEEEDEEEEEGAEKSEIDQEIEKAEAILEGLKAKKVAVASPQIEKAVVDLGLITDLIKSQGDDINKKFTALGEITKAVLEENQSLKTSLEEVTNRLAKVEDAPVGRKSIQTKGFLEKGEQGAAIQTPGKHQLHIVRDKGKILDILESKCDFSDAAINKSDNKIFGDAMAQFEAAGVISKEVATRLFLQDNIQLVK